MLKLTGGRVFGAEPGFIPSLHDASPMQLAGLRASDDGVYLVVEDLDLHISVDGLVTRIMEASPLVIKRSGARLAGLATSPAKATSSARNGRRKASKLKIFGFPGRYHRNGNAATLLPIASGGAAGVAVKHLLTSAERGEKSLA